MDTSHTTTAFISAELKTGEVIYCNPLRDVDIGVGPGINGLQSVWKLNAPLEGTRPAANQAAIGWYQSSSQPITGFGFSHIGSGGTLQNEDTDDYMLLGTHVDDFLLASTSLMLAQAFALYFGK